MSQWTNADAIASASILASLAVGIAIVFATFRGPIIASREADARRLNADKRADKMRVFRDLMGHRYSVTHPNYVAALNLIQIEFSECPAVLSAFKDYLHAFHPEESKRADLAEIRKKAIVRLLTSIGDDLGYRVEQLDIMEQAYSPEGWATEAEQQRAVRELFFEVAQGKRGFPVLTMVPDPFVEDLGDSKFALRTIQASRAPKR
jgi:hypothetical protein